MTKWINQIDDTIGIGSSIITQMRDQGGEYGIGLSTNFECHNQVASGIVTATSFEGGSFVSTSTTRPFYPPVVTSTQMSNMTGITTGATVFNTSSMTLHVYNGTSWNQV